MPKSWQKGISGKGKKVQAVLRNRKSEDRKVTEKQKSDFFAKVLDRSLNSVIEIVDRRLADLASSIENRFASFEKELEELRRQVQSRESVDLNDIFGDLAIGVTEENRDLLGLRHELISIIEYHWLEIEEAVMSAKSDADLRAIFEPRLKNWSGMAPVVKYEGLHDFIFAKLKLQNWKLTKRMVLASRKQHTDLSDTESFEIFNLLPTRKIANALAGTFDWSCRYSFDICSKYPAKIVPASNVWLRYAQKHPDLFSNNEKESWAI